MKSLKNFWTQEEDNILKEFRSRMTISQIYDELRKQGYARSPKSIEHRCLRLLLFRGEEGDNELTQDNSEDLSAFLESFARIKAMGKDFTTKDTTLRNGFADKVSGYRKILATGDWHIPFEKHEMIMDMLLEHKDSDAIVITGDLFDLYSVSVFPKNKWVPLIQEYRIAREWLKILSMMFPKVILLNGNHEARIHSYFIKNVSQEVVPFVAQPVMERLALGFIYDDKAQLIGMKPFDNVVYVREFPWYSQIGKTIFVHPDSYYGDTAGGRVLGTVVRADNYFRTKRDYDSIIMAHTHKVGMAIRDGVMLMEHGCACNMLEYQQDDRKFRYGTQHNGYSLIYQDHKGNTDWNESRVVFRGAQWPQKEGEKIWNE